MKLRHKYKREDYFERLAIESCYDYHNIPYRVVDGVLRITEVAEYKAEPTDCGIIKTKVVYLD